MSRRRPMAADELMRELESDPEWRAAQAEKERRVAEQHERYAEQEAPVVAALAMAGVEGLLEGPELADDAARKLERR